MKIAQMVGWYFPDSTGGSETYVASLSAELRRMGHEVVVVVPHESDDSTEHEGLRVRRYARWPEDAENLARVLVDEKPDVAHFQSWTRGMDHCHLKRSAELGIRTMMTAHTAEAFCARGTMLRWGRVACDGEMRPLRCSACYLQGRGLAAPLAMVAAGLGGVAPFSAKMSRGRLSTSLGLPSVIASRRAEMHGVWKGCERVFAVCGWVKEALVRNGCPAEKLVLARQGSMFHAGVGLERVKSQTVRFGFLGRLHPSKGAHLAIKAFRCLKPSSVHLELKGVEGEPSHAVELHGLARGDERIRWVESSGDVRAWLEGVDALVVPSLIMETGPLVVYEAFASGVPVIGSRLGGISELVHHEVNGLLFDPGSVDALVTQLGRFAANADLRATLRRGIGRVRTMREVAEEMDHYYRGMTTS